MPEYYKRHGGPLRSTCVWGGGADGREGPRGGGRAQVQGAAACPQLARVFLLKRMVFQTAGSAVAGADPEIDVLKRRRCFAALTHGRLGSLPAGRARRG